MNIVELGTGKAHLWDFAAVAVPLTIFTAIVLMYQGSRFKAQQTQRTGGIAFDRTDTRTSGFIFQGGRDRQKFLVVDEWVLWVNKAVKWAAEKMSSSKQPSIGSRQDSKLEKGEDMEMTVRIEQVD
jgi:hypothetical protein